MPYTSGSGKATWHELHRRAAHHKSGTDNMFIYNYVRRLPDGGCKCRTKFKKWMKDYPPDFTSRDSYFAWTVHAHNEVNRDLGKPLISLEDAKDMYYN